MKVKEEKRVGGSKENAPSRVVEDKCCTFDLKYSAFEPA